MSSKSQTVKGFRDFLPEQMAVRNRVITILRGVFEKYGFAELQTPALEYQEVLLGKYGEEAEKLMYLFEDSGQRKVGMKYDLTVPLARVMASYQDLPKPFKRYQIQPVWRAENTQKGRYREFYQCDVDTIGSRSPLADAEIIAIINDSLEALGFEDFSININSRTVLFQLMSQSSLPENLHLTTIQSIDKLDKKSEDAVKEELASKGLSQEQIEAIFSAMQQAKPDDFLQQTMEFAKQMGVDDDRMYFSPSLARGLDYYTGPIFETVVTAPKIGSITGGGRYDNLLKSLGGPDEPAVGTTIGLDRIVDVITELDLQAGISSTPTRVLVTLFDENSTENVLDIANTLREAGVNTEVILDTEKGLDKQLKYADKKEIPYVLIQGPEELAENNYTLKNLRARTQEKLTFEQVLATLISNR